MSISLFERIRPAAAGIDCGQDRNFVAVAPETLAMESTGVYWTPLYEILEQRDFEGVLVNSLHNVHGRQSDDESNRRPRCPQTMTITRGRSFQPIASR